MHSVKPRDSFLAALVATIWGVNFVVIQWGMEGVQPLLFAALRFAAVAVPAVFLVPKPDAPWRTVLAVGAFMSLGQFGFLYSAMHAGMPPGLAALVLQSQVVFTIVLAALRLGELPSRRQVIGVGVASAGLVIVGVGRGGNVPLLALALCLLGGLSWGIGNVVSRASGIRSGLSLTVWSAVIVPLPLLVLSLLLDGPSTVGSALAHFSWKSILSTVYTAGLASLLGYSIFNGLLSRYTPSAVVPWVLVAPIVAMLSAWLLLEQRPNAGETIGGALLLIGVLVALRPGASGAGSSRFPGRKSLQISGSQKVLTSGAESTVASESAGCGSANR